MFFNIFFMSKSLVFFLYYQKKYLDNISLTLNSVTEHSSKRRCDE